MNDRLNYLNKDFDQNSMKSKKEKKALLMTSSDEEDFNKNI